jgi:hypothetical protein
MPFKKKIEVSDKIALFITKPRRYVQFEDLITVEKPKLIKLAPDGTKIAFVIENSNIEENTVTDALYIWDRQFGLAKALLRLDKITKILWINDAVYALGQKRQKYQIHRIKNTIAELIISSSDPISTFTAINHSKLFYTQIISTAKKDLKKAMEEGYIYQWGKDSTINLINKQYEHYEVEEIWCLDILSGEKQFLIKFDYKNLVDHWSLITAMELSPDETKLAINLNRIGNSKSGAPGLCKDLIIFDFHIKGTPLIL